MSQKHIVRIDEIQVLTADVKKISCKTITVHLEANSIDANNIAETIRWWFQWMGHIYYTRDIINTKSSFEGAIRLVINRDWQDKNMMCTRLHIADTQILDL